MLAEVERRIDVFVFRCCFAHSVYEAQRLVIHGFRPAKWQKATELILNFPPTDANTRLAPDDMISVDPAAIRFLQESKSSKAESSDTDSRPESSDPSRPTKPHSQSTL
ncbi:hypothetical protein M405DRAFT_816847 [Rhizopogon salebrosus TDB-379]|nr:hypothetical protein M405DRAFT_816847 [Rhizopogon salebrosus TDB-379]